MTGRRLAGMNTSRCTFITHLSCLAKWPLFLKTITVVVFQVYCQAYPVGSSNEYIQLILQAYQRERERERVSTYLGLVLVVGLFVVPRSVSLSLHGVSE